MYLKGTKQEWAKIYALFKLLTNDEVFAGDLQIQSKKDSAWSWKRIIREIPNGSVSFSKEGNEIIALIQEQAESSTEENTSDISEESIEIIEKKISTPIATYQTFADQLLTLLKGKEDIIECDEIEQLLDELHIFDFVSGSEAGDDFQVVFFDKTLNVEIYRPVRVRSLLDNLYLVPANRASNFKYDITQVKFSNPESNKINALGNEEIGSLVRLEEIFRLGGKLKYAGVEGKFFLNALQLIDMQLPKLISEMVRLFYTTDHITVKDLCIQLNQINLFKVKEEVIEKSRIYEYKIRQFLYAAACGMKPTKTWRGNGNSHLQLFVTNKGELLRYDPIEKEFFEKFLLANTRLCLSSEEKNKYGFVEKENGQWLIKLNLEIRFC